MTCLRNWRSASETTLPDTGAAGLHLTSFVTFSRTQNSTCLSTRHSNCPGVQGWERRAWTSLSSSVLSRFKRQLPIAFLCVQLCECLKECELLQAICRTDCVSALLCDSNKHFCFVWWSDNAWCVRIALSMPWPENILQRQSEGKTGILTWFSHKKNNTNLSSWAVHDVKSMNINPLDHLSDCSKRQIHHALKDYNDMLVCLLNVIIWAPLKQSHNLAATMRILGVMFVSQTESKTICGRLFPAWSLLFQGLSWCQAESLNPLWSGFCEAAHMAYHSQGIFTFSQQGEKCPH